MTKSEYAKLLLTPEWNEVRLKVLKRDHYCCKKCGMGNQRLSVHHKIYLEGKMPWEVPMQYLETLCDRCHEAAHEGRLIKEFIKKRIPTEQKNKVKKEKSRTLSRDEKVWIAQLCVLQRVQPTVQKWATYKRQLYEYKGLSSTEVLILFNAFSKIKKKAKKRIK
jgi:hypothetical protein